MSQADPWTIGRLLKWTTGFFSNKGVDPARLEAELLLAEALHCQRIELYTAFDRVVNEPTLTEFRELIRRRAEGTPVAYLLGRREFFSLSFRVSPDVLIPRPETEFVVLALLDRLPKNDRQEHPLQIADVGTGSGILAVCAARFVPGSRVTAIDVSDRAIAVARRNAADHDVSGQIEFLRGDLLSGIPAGRQFDFILSNPPYVSTAEFEDLPADVKDHEPQVALLAGSKGTEIVARLIPQSADRLHSGGWLILEISPMIERAVHELLDSDGRFQPVATVKDLAGLARIVTARRN